MHTHTVHGSRRRRRSQSATVRLKDTPALRLAKVAALGFVGLIALIIIAAKFLVPAQNEAHFMTAEQERACTQAYLSADAKLTSALCDPDHWRQAGASGSSQASLP